jgi:TRAP transporter TAXI family solute receptor
MLKRKGPTTRKELFILFSPAVLVTLVGFFAAYQFVEPSPPRTITIATGEPDGAYFKYGNIYKPLLKENGIELKIRTTAGAFENLQLLEDDDSGVDIAFIQGGIGKLSTSKDIISIGSLYYEPLMIFCGPGIRPARITDMKGLRIAVGKEKSGTKILSTRLLELNGINENNTQFISRGSKISADMLSKNEVDIAFFVSSPWTANITQLIKTKSISLMGLDRADAYKFWYRYLNVITIPQGILDFKADIPDHEIKILAPTAQLAVRADLHPALIDLLLQATRTVHTKGGGVNKEGEFPSPKYLDFELSQEAERFYSSRTPFLQRYFPFWVATFISRMTVMILPLLAIMYPLFKLMPWVYRWRMRARIYRWYADLAAVGTKVHGEHSLKERGNYMAELDELEKNVANINVPQPYAQGLFHLRMHIDMFRKKLMETQKPKG